MFVGQVWYPNLEESVLTIEVQYFLINISCSIVEEVSSEHGLAVSMLLILSCDAEIY